MRYRIVLAAICMLLLIACNGNENTADTPTASPVPSATNTPLPSPTETIAPPPSATVEPTAAPTELVQVGPDNFPSQVSPFTGLQASDPYWLDRRPLAVKIQIFPRGQRPVMGASVRRYRLRLLPEQRHDTLPCNFLQPECRRGRPHSFRTAAGC